MYPRVKVRKQEEDDDQYDFETRSLRSLKGLESLSLDDLSSPDDSPTSVVRIPRLNSSNSATPFVSVHKVRNKKHEVLDENRTIIRASPVPRPRAVLSSPDNDGIIGSKNKRRKELLSGLKNHNLCENRHTQCKVVPRPIATEGSVTKTRELKEVADSKGGLQARQRTTISDPSQKGVLQKWKTKRVNSE